MQSVQKKSKLCVHGSLMREGTTFPVSHLYKGGNARNGFIQRCLYSLGGAGIRIMALLNSPSPMDIPPREVLIAFSFS
jgi:hypothetical protein